MKKLLTLFAFLFAFIMHVNFSPGTADTPEKEIISWQVADMSALEGVETLTVHYEPVFLDQYQIVDTSADQTQFMVYRASLTKSSDSRDMLQTSISKNHQDESPTKTESPTRRSDKHFDPGSYGHVDKEA